MSNKVYTVISAHEGGNLGILEYDLTNGDKRVSIQGFNEFMSMVADRKLITSNVKIAVKSYVAGYNPNDRLIIVATIKKGNRIKGYITSDNRGNIALITKDELINLYENARRGEPIVQNADYLGNGEIKYVKTLPSIDVKYFKQLNSIKGIENI